MCLSTLCSVYSAKTIWTNLLVMDHMQSWSKRDYLSITDVLLYNSTHYGELQCIVCIRIYRIQLSLRSRKQNSTTFDQTVYCVGRLWRRIRVG